MSEAARIVRAALDGPEAVDAALAGRDDAELVAVAAAARELAVALATDPLTGLPGRTAQAHASAAGAVLVVDVDGLKARNDTEGHAAGDALLQAVAGALRRALRASDGLFRVGGDEFVAHLGPATAVQATAAAERLRAAVAGETDGTVSIGVAVQRAGEDTAATQGRADGAAYAAKAAGRDRIALADGD
jgi:diguanylate cyclase (GGDEF)-like protein